MFIVQSVNNIAKRKVVLSIVIPACIYMWSMKTQTMMRLRAHGRNKESSLRASASSLSSQKSQNWFSHGQKIQTRTHTHLSRVTDFHLPVSDYWIIFPLCCFSEGLVTTKKLIKNTTGLILSAPKGLPTPLSVCACMFTHTPTHSHKANVYCDCACEVK